MSSQTKTPNAATVAAKQDNGAKQLPEIVPAKQAVVKDPEQPKEPASKIPTIAERLERFSQLEKYVGQLQLVEESLQELQEFKPDPSGGDQIIIKEADGTTHSTRHPLAVEAMVKAAVELLKAKKTEIESFIVL